MILPVQITFRDMEPSEAVEARIREEAAKLDTYCGEIMSCRVVVEIPHKHHVKGNLYRIRIDLVVPGGELVAEYKPSLHSSTQHIGTERAAKKAEVAAPHKDIYVAIRDAFDDARRRLQDYVRRRRGKVKVHEPAPRAHVLKLFPGGGYGFLETADGREIYFHEKSVLNDVFDQLEVGAEVVFAEEEGEKGPQASTVRLAGKKRHH